MYTSNLQNLEIEEGGLRQLSPMVTEVSSVLEDHMMFLLRATCIINSHFVEPLRGEWGVRGYNTHRYVCFYMQYLWLMRVKEVTNTG